MSRKTARNKTNPERTSSQPPSTPAATQGRRWGLLIGAVVTVLFVVLAGKLLFTSKATQPSPSAGAANAAALASEHSPTLGDPGAAVHIVEFLDPACETCALMYPYVKQMLADNPGQIRLSLRHVPFHEGADFVVRLLEASRGQDKYWQTLEALLATQAQWAPHHTVQPDLVWPAIAGVGLDTDRLRADMNAPEVAERMKRDIDDARALKVTATPEYFVNGRPLPSFGLQQLQDLVNEALRSSAAPSN
jgi:protein-disulfide isomerase